MARTVSRVGLVLPGGAALGAYEAGVLDYLARDLSDSLGAPVPLDILCGTSVGALGAALLAAHADQPRVGTERLLRLWASLRVERFLRLSILSRWLGERRGTRVGGLLRSRPVEQLIADAAPFEGIANNLRRHRLTAIGISTTHVASGSTVVFVQGSASLVGFGRDRNVAARRARLGAEHLLASAAIPLLFPAVCIDGEVYCEGGLRQNVPLAPALHLGADRLIVVTPHHIAPADARLGRARERAISGPLFLAGRMLNALLLDRVDADVDRLEQINALLAAGKHAFGPRFDDLLLRQRRPDEPPLRPVGSVVVRASESIGRLAGEFVRSHRFDGRGLVGRLLRRLADAERTPEADLTAYLLFDGAFAAELIALGREDARAQHDALAELVEPRLRARPSLQLDVS